MWTSFFIPMDNKRQHVILVKIFSMKDNFWVAEKKKFICIEYKTPQQ